MRGGIGNSVLGVGKCGKVCWGVGGGEEYRVGWGEKNFF